VSRFHHFEPFSQVRPTFNILVRRIFTVWSHFNFTSSSAPFFFYYFQSLLRVWGIYTIFSAFYECDALYHLQLFLRLRFYPAFSAIFTKAARFPYFQSFVRVWRVFTIFSHFHESDAFLLFSVTCTSATRFSPFSVQILLVASCYRNWR